MAKKNVDRSVLVQVLFNALCRHPEGLRPPEAYRAIDAVYQFPKDWYRPIPTGVLYSRLRGLNWRTIPPAELIEMGPTEPQWQNEMRWARNVLRTEGLLDTSAPYGVWRLVPGRTRAATPMVDDAVRRAADAGAQRSAAETVRQAERVLHLQPATLIVDGFDRDDALKRLEYLARTVPDAGLALLLAIARQFAASRVPSTPDD